MIQAKISSGEFQSRSIELPPQGVTRAGTGKVRSAIFNSIEVTDCKVLDLFAGGGTLGFEALSLGASEATFVDHSLRVFKVLHRNAKSLGVESRTIIVKKSVRSFASHSKEVYDVVFFDPPYIEFDIALVKGISNLVQLGGILVISTSSKVKYDIPNEYFQLAQKLYGDTKITYLQKQ